MYWRFVGCLVACLVLAGCTIPASEHPLSDEKTSVLDDRLIGYWTCQPKDKDDKEPPMPFVIGRLKDKPNVLELTTIEIDGEGHAKITQVPMYTLKIGDERYLSIPMQEEGVEKPGHLIARYELADDGTSQLYLMNSETIAAAIEGGKLTGTVKRQQRPEGADPNQPATLSEVRITAEPKELTAYLKAHGKECFVLDEPQVFKRTKRD